MAVASHQPHTLTSPESGQGAGEWDFAVPLNDQKALYTDQKPFMSEDVPAAQPHSPRQALHSQPNGFAKPARISTIDSQRQYDDNDQGYLAANRVEELQRKGSDLSANGSSDPDGVLEYYKPPASKKNKRSSSRTKGPKNGKKAVAPKWTEEEKDESNWIHRDKLKEIETRELEEAGYRVGRTSRSNSKAHSTSRDRKGSETSEFAHDAEEHYDAHREVSPASPVLLEDEAEEDGPAQWDLRSPEEIAADRESYGAQNHVIRPSTSRIPIAKISPAPVPNTLAERDAPLPRSRTGSQGWNGDIATNGARVRSGSMSSQVLLDDGSGSEGRLRTPPRGERSGYTSPVTGSPPKARVPSKAGPTSGARKTSNQRSTSQARRGNASGQTPHKRPGTSGGSISRPVTSHRPEGEAPWIATMYKPDPRLPPEQQIIPTHAKRMQQDRWETEGKTGSMYDRDFRLLNTEEFKRNSDIKPIELDKLEKKEDDGQWPLPSPTKTSLPTEPAHPTPKSPTNEAGGYKLTPKIQQSPRIPSPTTSPKPTNTTRVPEPPADDKEKKSCACCIVM